MVYLAAEKLHNTKLILRARLTVNEHSELKHRGWLTSQLRTWQWALNHTGRAFHSGKHQFWRDRKSYLIFVFPRQGRHTHWYRMMKSFRESTAQSPKIKYYHNCGNMSKLFFQFVFVHMSRILCTYARLLFLHTNVHTSTELWMNSVTLWWYRCCHVILSKRCPYAAYSSHFVFWHLQRGLWQS